MKTIMKLAVITIAVCLVGSVALAEPTGPVYNVSVSGSGYGPSGSNYHGGSFNVSGDLGTFRTFCSEVNVSGFGSYATIDDMVYFADGTDGMALPDDVKNVMAHWFTGGYSALSLSDDQAGNTMLQAYLWKHLYNGVWPDTVWQAYYATNETAIEAIDDNLATHAGIGNVMVLNLWTTSDLGQMTPDTDKQSQFILIPAPGAALLGAIGLAGIGWLRRRWS